MAANKISIIGLGYIGLPTAAMFASKGMSVVGIDVNEDVVNTINRGQIHIIEPELDVAVKNAVETGKLRASLVPESADAFIIAVPTPFKNDKKPDLSYIQAAAKLISPVLKTGDLVILESTSPVGATEKLANWLADFRPDLSVAEKGKTVLDVNVAHCPERVLPGQIMRELIENDRIVGGITSECTEKAISLYKLFVEAECISTDARTAELSKLTENSFRDVNIAFANELSMICDELSVDVWELISLANRHPRVNILQPGCGVGGHCIAVDPWFIVDSAPDSSKLIASARKVNDLKPSWVVKQIAKKCKQKNTKVVTCLGVTFKPNIDDVRESPALLIVEKLLASGFVVNVVEPNIKNFGREDLNHFNSYKDIDLSEGVVAVLVAHDEFKQLESNPANRCILDFCGIFKNTK